MATIEEYKYQVDFLTKILPLIQANFSSYKAGTKPKYNPEQMIKMVEGLAIAGNNIKTFLKSSSEISKPLSSNFPNREQIMEVNPSTDYSQTVSSSTTVSYTH